MTLDFETDDFELVTGPEPFAWPVDREILGGQAFAGLTPSEQRALAITSTLETGKRGGFYGLSGNFDGMGLSFGLVNWNIGAGSLQPLLLELLNSHPERWRAAFLDDADRFANVLRTAGEDAKQNQLAFVITEMNTRAKVNGKLRWVINDRWSAHFRRLADDPVFQAIQVRGARVLLARAKYFCDYFGLRTDRAFCMMFDAVSSHGKWWLTRKDDSGVETRRLVLRSRLTALAAVHGTAIPEHAKLRAIAETLGATSRPEWKAKALERKLWFLTGEHRRKDELRGLEPTDAPFTTSTGTTATPTPAPAPAPSAPPVAPRPGPTAPAPAGAASAFDVPLVFALLQGARDHGDLADAVFLERHPERKGARIAPGETAAIAEWKAIRARAAQLFPTIADRSELELELEAGTGEDGAVTPVVTRLIAGGERDPDRLASEAFYALHPERNRRKIARGETDAAAQWKRLRAGVVARLLAQRTDAPAATPAAPRLIRSDDGAGGTTLYLDQQLGDERPAPAITSVFVPHGYRTGRAVDVILYLHGHKQGHYRDGGAMSIMRYWTEEKRAPLRQAVADAGRNAILIAPTLGPSSQAHALNGRGGLDRYLARTLAGAAAHGPWRGATVELRNLVLAAHSGGGIWMHHLARGTDRAARENLRECWGFDCFYNPKIEKVGWPAWARQYPDKRLYGYHGTSPPRAGAALLAGKAPNLTMIKATTASDPHWDTLRNHFGERVTGAPFFDRR